MCIRDRSTEGKGGLAALDKIAPFIFSILCIPAAASLPSAAMVSVYAAAVKYCRDRRAFLIVDITADTDKPAEVLNLLNALESLSSETCQEMVGTLNTPALRGEVFAVGIAAARRAAALALAANPQRPGAYVSAADATNAGVELPAVTTTTVASAGPPLTEIPAVSAIPSQFGQLGPVFLVVGNGDENGVRFKANLETPHDNSLIYEGMAASCCASPA